MVQAEHHLDAAAMQRPEHIAIVLQGLPINLTFPGVDPGPFDGEAVYLDTDSAGQIVIFRIAVPVVAGSPAGLPDPALPGLSAHLSLFPPEPVAVPVAPLHLVGGGRRPPPETGGEAVCFSLRHFLHSPLEQ